MATLILGAAGAALGAGFGGAIAGLSGAVIGRAVGATVGRALDQRILGMGSEPVEVGRLNRLSIMSAGEGGRIARSWGRMRLPGHVIWASDFLETKRRSGSGKGAPQPRAIHFSYSVSLAIALCEGEILGIGRVWADGKELPEKSLDMRVYHGTEAQLPDPLITLKHGLNGAPAFRGTAYVVMENLSLEQFGNRVPQFTFEVLRRAKNSQTAEKTTYQDIIKAVAVIPGTGECALATKKVSARNLFGDTEVLNVKSLSENPDFNQSILQLERELPACNAVSLVISWFGNDLRCGMCSIKPKASLSLPPDSIVSQPIKLGGVDFLDCDRVAEIDGRTIYGGTPSDESIIQAIEHLNASGKDIMFYPFVLMEQIAGNTLSDPYSESMTQPELPWRGRITLSIAPGRPESPDGTLLAEQEVQEFFGNAQVGDFSVNGRNVIYSGLDGWGYRRFVLHSAYLCQIAGGVESFCIGSEMRGLTTIMGENHSFPAVQALVSLAEDVRSILGPDVKISYAADWSEYFGIRRKSDVLFHLDQLWGSQNIDFIGIDNYMPISDWRRDSDHADLRWDSIYNLNYLSANIEGGEGYEWYYDGQEARGLQLRSPISDAQYGEDWVFRFKDIKSWWSNPHHNRIDGIRQENPTEWLPGSKPIRFTEYGCAAVDSGTNEPNKFLDLRSSEAGLPVFSSGERDDYIQLQYFRAIDRYWGKDENNPISTNYPGRMIDLAHCYAWAWDARPYPDFPRNEVLWEDGQNWSRGHWLNGRATLQPLDAVLEEICEAAGLDLVDTSQVHGGLWGYSDQEVGSARSSVQPLSLVYGFDVIEREGVLTFVSRGGPVGATIRPEETVENSDDVPSIQETRLGEGEVTNHIRLGFVSASGKFEERMVEQNDAATLGENSAYSEFVGLLNDDLASAVVRRWLIEAELGRNSVTLNLPRSSLMIDAGSVISFKGFDYRVDRVELGESLLVDANRIDSTAYRLKEIATEISIWDGFQYPDSVRTVFMDIPSASTSTQIHSPFVGAIGRTWNQSVGVWQGLEDADYTLINTIDTPATGGVTETVFKAGQTGRLDNHSYLVVKLSSGILEGCSMSSLLAGKNLAAVGDGSAGKWELFQFQHAELIEAGKYRLTGFIRNQLGTDGAVERSWPAGTIFVLIDDNIVRLNLADSFRNVEIDLRAGDINKGPINDESEFFRTAFSGNGLRPYSVCHFRSRFGTDGDIVMNWVRRTRLGGDDWSASDVPLSEEREAYRINIWSSNGELARSVEVTSASFTYAAVDRSADGLSNTFDVEIAQISASYGAGTWRKFHVAL